VIVAGVTIGKHSVIAAGSIVTKNIPPYSVAVGNPARVIKQYDAGDGTWKKV
jgi:acetyltransferase-like isoleucine patch superfamily enzyme